MVYSCTVHFIEGKIVGRKAEKTKVTSSSESDEEASSSSSESGSSSEDEREQRRRKERRRRRRKQKVRKAGKGSHSDLVREEEAPFDTVSSSLCEMVQAMFHFPINFQFEKRRQQGKGDKKNRKRQKKSSKKKRKKRERSVRLCYSFVQWLMFMSNLL